MRRLFALFTMFLFVGTLMAVPAKRTQFVHTQSDGTKLTLMLVGDEHLSYYLNVDTNEKMILAANGDFAKLSETDFVARKDNALARRKMIEERRATRLVRNTRKDVQNGGPNKVGEFKPMQGQKKGLVILVNFTNKSMLSQHDQECFDEMFNEVGYSKNNHIGSVHDYFLDQSYGQFDLSFDVLGPIELSGNIAYYGGNNSWGNDKRPGEMVKEACEAVDDIVDFNDYDWDGDGEVDQVFIVYAGFGEHASNNSDLIWPHEWQLSYALGNPLTFDGVTVDTYACTCELSGAYGSSLNGIGTACHEFSHCLGYPDLYDTDYSGGNAMDYFDVMCSGSYNGPSRNGEVPSGYTSYERWIGGWLEPIEIDAPETYTDIPALNDEGVAYIIYNKDNTDEFMMLENRQSNRWFGYFGSSIAGHGLFISHIDYNAYVWANNQPNDDPNHQRVSWIPADKSYSTYNNGHQGDYFPGTKRVTRMNGTTHASYGAKWFNKENDSKTFPHELTDIKEDNGLISFDFDGGNPDDGSRWTVVFDAGSGECEVDTFTQTVWAEGVTLPEATSNIENWTFLGWSHVEVEETQVKPEVFAAGEVYVPANDTTLYAVYRYAEEGFAEENMLYGSNPSLNERAALVAVNISAMPDKLEYTELDEFVKDGLVVTAVYEDETEREVFNYSYSPKVISADTENVTVTYIEKGITATAEIPVVVNLLPRYTVTFNVNGEEVDCATEIEYQSGVEVPEVEDINEYRFLGWSVTPKETEDLEKPVLEEVTDDRFMPVEDTTLYAIFSREVIDEEAGPTVYEFNCNTEAIPTAFDSDGVIVTQKLVDFSFIDVLRDDSCLQVKRSTGLISAVMPTPIISVDIIYDEHSPAKVTDRSSGLLFNLKSSPLKTSKITSITVTCETAADIYYASIITEEDPDDPSSGILGISESENELGNTYNVAGQRVGNNYKGIVIRNGRKYIEK